MLVLVAAQVGIPYSEVRSCTKERSSAGTLHKVEPNDLLMILMLMLRPTDKQDVPSGSLEETPRSVPKGLGCPFSTRLRFVTYPCLSTLSNALNRALY